MEKETAMEILRKLHDSSLFAERTALETIIPELKESKDERIRKNIIAALKGEGYYDCDLTNEFIAWVEKQGNPQDKGEISDGYHTFNELYYYRMLYNAAFFNMLPKEWVHKSKKHHDGEDCFGGGWFIVMANLPTGQISNHYELKNWDLFQIPEKEVADKWDGHTPQEAADRLHKYLLEKQGEVPVTINVDKMVRDYANNKEHGNEGFGKPVNCMIRAYRQGIMDALEKQGACFAKWQKNTPENKPPLKHSVLIKTTQGIAEGEWQDEHWFQYRWSWTLKDRDVLAWMELSDLDKQGEQKPTWSDEDEGIVLSIEQVIQCASLLNIIPEKLDKIDKWLKSIRHRVQPHTTKWSEEDEDMAGRIRDALRGTRYNYYYKDLIEMIDWLKSLKERITWKPSEEQMEALDDALNERGYDYNNLNSLYEQLKKL